MSFLGEYIRQNGIYAEYEDKTFRFDPFKLILSGNGNKIKIKSILFMNLKLKERLMAIP